MFLYGGNDSSNMVLRTDTASFAEYTRLRNQAPESIALLAPGTAPNDGATRASPARLGGVAADRPEVHGLAREQRLHLRAASGDDRGAEPVRRGRLAILANAGPLVVPLTRAEYTSNSKPRPQALGSHNDQQSTWQALGPEGVKIGWGGHLGDMVASQQHQRRSSPASRCRATRCSRPARRRSSTRSAAAARPRSAASPARCSARRRRRRRCARSSRPTTSTCSPRSTRRSSTARSTAQATFQTAFNASTVAAPTQYNVPSTGNNANNGLAQQIQTVARVIGARNALGAKRQVFFVSMGGFDTHDGQNTQPGRPAGAALARARLLRHGDVEHRRRRHAQQRHPVHRVRLRPDDHEQRRRHRPRLGRAPLRRRRRGQRRRDLRSLPAVPASTHDHGRRPTTPTCRSPRSTPSARRSASGSASATPTSTRCSRT